MHSAQPAHSRVRAQKMCTQQSPYSPTCTQPCPFFAESTSENTHSAQPPLSRAHIKPMRTQTSPHTADLHSANMKSAQSLHTRAHTKPVHTQASPHMAEPTLSQCTCSPSSSAQQSTHSAERPHRRAHSANAYSAQPHIAEPTQQPRKNCGAHTANAHSALFRITSEAAESR